MSELWFGFMSDSKPLFFPTTPHLLGSMGGNQCENALENVNALQMLFKC